MMNSLDRPQRLLNQSFGAEKENNFRKQFLAFQEQRYELVPQESHIRSHSGPGQMGTPKVPFIWSLSLPFHKSEKTTVGLRYPVAA